MLGILQVFYKLLKYWQLFIVPLLYLHELNYNLSQALLAFIYNVFVLANFCNPFFVIFIRTRSLKTHEQNIGGKFSCNYCTTKHALKQGWTEFSIFISSEKTNQQNLRNTSTKRSLYNRIDFVVLSYFV